MKTIHRLVVPFKLLFVILLAGYATPVFADDPPSATPITPRMLVQPGALMGTPPVGFAWHPTDVVLAYVERQDGEAALVMYAAATGEKRTLLTAADAPVGVDLSAATHPRFDVPYTATVYQPMLELLAFLRANGFKTFVVSGGGVEFMRAYAEDVYGIARDDVIGSSVEYAFQATDDGFVLVRLPEIATVDLNAAKPVNIQRHIGRRPILAAGNSDGDIEMLQYTGGGSGPFLNLVIVHDDAEREYDYLEGADNLMGMAAQSPWMFVSMQRDFNQVFP